MPDAARENQNAAATFSILDVDFVADPAVRSELR